MKTINESEEVISLIPKQIQQLRKEFLERISQGKLESTWQLEALDRTFMISQVDPIAFHRNWIQPLLAAGLSLEAAIAHIVDSYLRPN